MKAWAVVAVCLAGWVCSFGAWAESVRTLAARDLARPHRIVGGDPVKKGQMPWQVSLQTNGHHFCGATLISESLAITAAHCAKAGSTSGRDITVVVGAWDLNEAARSYKVKDMAINDYDTKTFNKDIALLLLGDPVDGASARDQLPSGQPIALETRTEHGAGAKCTISGWGRLQSGSTLPHILRAADVEVKSDSQCTEMFFSYPYNNLDTNLCAGGSSRDACQGDSGGPLVCCSKSTEDVASCRLAGITSWGIGCATDGVPGVYTEVAHYIDWIKKTTKTKFGAEQTRSLTFFDDEKEREFT